MKKGIHHTRKTKEKMGLSQKIRYKNNPKKHPFYNYHIKGKTRPPFSKKWKENMSLAQKGNPHLYMRGNNNPMKIPKIAKKVSLARKGIEFSDKTKEKMSLNHADISGNKNPMSGKHHTKKSIELMSIKALNRSEEHIKKIFKSLHIKPNKKEKFLFKLIKINHFPYKFVGDGKFILAGKCPDFLNCNGQKKVIELFGDYWHRNDNPQKRIRLFAKYGFKTLIIWERELKNSDNVIQKIKEFDKI